MKRGTPHHRKMHALAEALKLPLYSAVGIMEMVWHFAAQYTQEGDIGRVPDRVIAGAVDWDKKPQVLIDALVAVGWLDRNEEHRLIVHDWPEHCEQAVVKWLQRNSKTVLPIYGRCPDTVRTMDGQNPDAIRPSRGATAEAKASGFVSERAREIVSAADPEAVQQVRDWLYEYMAEQWPMPDIPIAAKVYEAMNGASLEELGVFLRQLYRQGQRPERSWAWFPPVIRRHFAGRKHAISAAV